MRDLLGAWLLVAMLIVNKIKIDIQPTVLDMFGFPHTSMSADPPWDFIREAFSTGICAAGALIASLALAAIGWKRFRLFAGILVGWSIITQGGDIVKAMIIYLNCPKFLDPSLAVSHWPTFDSYMKDATIRTAQSIIPFVGAGLGMALISRMCNKANETPAAPNLAQ